MQTLLFFFFLSSFLFFPFSAKSSRKLTFLYLANDVIQNSKRKGPEFTREFESVLVDAFSHVARYVAVFLQLSSLGIFTLVIQSLIQLDFVGFLSLESACTLSVVEIGSAFCLGTVQCKWAILCVNQPFTASRVCSLCAAPVDFISIVTKRSGRSVYGHWK